MAKRRKSHEVKKVRETNVKLDWKHEIKVSQNYICPICGKEGTDRSLNLHHIINKCKNGRNTRENCVALHVTCHRWLHERYGNKTVDMRQFAHYMVEPIDYEEEDK